MPGFNEYLRFLVFFEFFLCGYGFDSFTESKLSKLIDYVILESKNPLETQKRRFKFPQVACDILSSGKETILDFFLEEEIEPSGDSESEFGSLGEENSDQEENGIIFITDSSEDEKEETPVIESDEEEDDSPCSTKDNSLGTNQKAKTKNQELKGIPPEPIPDFQPPLEILFHCLDFQKEREGGVNEAVLGYFCKILKTLFRHRRIPVPRISSKEISDNLGFI